MTLHKKIFILLAWCSYKTTVHSWLDIKKLVFHFFVALFAIICSWSLCHQDDLARHQKHRHLAFNGTLHGLTLMLLMKLHNLWIAQG